MPLRGKLAATYLFYTKLASVPSGRFLRFLRDEAVLPIFWTLGIVRPMSDEGGDGHSRVPIQAWFEFGADEGRPRPRESKGTVPVAKNRTGSFDRILPARSDKCKQGIA